MTTRQRKLELQPATYRADSFSNFDATLTQYWHPIASGIYVDDGGAADHIVVSVKSTVDDPLTTFGLVRVRRDGEVGVPRLLRSGEGEPIIAGVLTTVGVTGSAEVVVEARVPNDAAGALSVFDAAALVLGPHALGLIPATGFPLQLGLSWIVDEITAASVGTTVRLQTEIFYAAAGSTAQVERSDDEGATWIADSPAFALSAGTPTVYVFPSNVTLQASPGTYHYRLRVNSGPNTATSGGVIVVIPVAFPSTGSYWATEDGGRIQSEDGGFWLAEDQT